jgi:hypothetical protein
MNAELVLSSLPPSDLFERLTCAALIVRRAVPPECEPVDQRDIEAAFALLDWARDHAKLPRLRAFAQQALFDARVQGPRSRSIAPVSAFLAPPEPPTPGAA